MSEVFFLCFAAASFLSDLLSRRIPNRFIAAGLVGALTVRFLEGGWHEIGAAVLGACTGFGCALPLRLIRAIGSGDVKWFAVAGAWLGGNDALALLVLSILCSGLAAFVWFAISKDFRKRLLGVGFQLLSVLHSRSIAAMIAAWKDISNKGKTIPFMAAVLPSVCIWIAFGSTAWMTGG